MLSTAVREALRLERVRLLEQVRGIDVLLASEAVPPTKADIADASVSGNGSGPVGLRVLVRQALKAHPKGLTTAEVAEEVERLGYKPKGSTSTISLLYGDLSRLRVKGELTKRGGKYMLPQEAGS